MKKNKPLKKGKTMQSTTSTTTTSTTMDVKALPLTAGKLITEKDSKVNNAAQSIIANPKDQVSVIHVKPAKVESDDEPYCPFRRNSPQWYSYMYDIND